MSDRRDAIMDVAERLIRTHGYNGFSFREIAAEVGIKSASVHHHFPTKADLAAAVAKRYRERFIASVDEEETAGASRVEAWRRLFRRSLMEDGLMCLCGILAAEGDALPEAVASEARRFLEGGVRSIGEVSGAEPGDGARVLAQLEGAMLLARAIGNPHMFDQATKNLGR